MSVRARFVRNILEEEGRKMLSRQGGAISSATESRTGRLSGSRRVNTSSGGDMDGMMSFTHVDYERFLDMRRRKDGSKRKRRRIHNRYIFGAYSSIAERLMFEFTDEVAHQLGKELG